MKKMFAIVFGVLFVLGSATVSAQSEVKNSKINVNSKNQNSLNMSLGKDSTASTGSVNIKGSEVKNSKINVNSKNKNSLNMSLGEGSTATTGSVTIE